MQEADLQAADMDLCRADFLFYPFHKINTGSNPGKAQAKAGKYIAGEMKPEVDAAESDQ